jgi:hypothetical protein
MSRSKAFRLAAVVLLLTAFSVWPRVAARHQARFTPFASASLPQRAVGDFDGDGRQDSAGIQARADGRMDIALRLSSSQTDIHLGSAVSALIGGDVDHDGDLDLVATTTSGEVLIWLNDGHGRFTPRDTAPTRDLAAPASISDNADDEPVAVAAAAPVIASAARSDERVVVTRIRPPTNPRALQSCFAASCSLRAPPTLLS